MSPFVDSPLLACFADKQQGKAEYMNVSPTLAAHCATSKQCANLRIDGNLRYPCQTTAFGLSYHPAKLSYIRPVHVIALMPRFGGIAGNTTIGISHDLDLNWEVGTYSAKSERRCEGDNDIYILIGVHHSSRPQCRNYACVYHVTRGLEISESISFKGMCRPRK